MKKLILSLFVTLLISGMINAKISYLELRTNYFNPSNRDFMDIYGGGIRYGLELGFDIRESFTVWIGGSYFKKKGELTYTSVKGQFEVIRAALRFSRVEPETISYVESHGTGTPLGDPVEIEALKIRIAAFFRDDFLCFFDIIQVMKYSGNLMR
jgi:hypothetical protein